MRLKRNTHHLFPTCEKRSASLLKRFYRFEAGILIVVKDLLQFLVAGLKVLRGDQQFWLKTFFYFFLSFISAGTAAVAVFTTATFPGTAPASGGLLDLILISTTRSPSLTVRGRSGAVSILLLPALVVTVGY